MSFYIGNGINGKEILHITSGTHTEAELKSGSALSDTVFHSNSSYLSYEISAVTYDAFTQASLYDNYRGYWRGFNTTLGPINSSDILFFLNSSKQPISKYTNWYQYNMGRDGYYVKSGSRVPAYNGTSGTYGIFQMDDGRRKYNDFLNTFNAATPAYIVRLKTIPSFNPTGSGLSFGNGDITIGGSSLLDFKYVYNGTLNNHPSSIQLETGQQLIDASQISGALSLISVGSSTTLFKGDTPIITSSGGFGTPLNTVTEAFYSQYLVYTAATFNTGQVISVKITTLSDTRYSATSFLTYANGKLVGNYPNGSFIEIVCENNRLKITSWTSIYRANYWATSFSLTITYYSQ